MTTCTPTHNPFTNVGYKIDLEPTFHSISLHAFMYIYSRGGELNCLCGSAHIISSLFLVSRHHISYSQALRSDKSHRFGRAGPSQLLRQIRPTGQASKLMRGTFLSLSSTYKFCVPLSDEVGQSSGKQHAASAGAPQCPLLQSRLVGN